MPWPSAGTSVPSGKATVRIGASVARPCGVSSVVDGERWGGPSAIDDPRLDFYAGDELVRVSEEAPIALVIEDDPIIRMDAVEILQVAGFRTIECSSADHAIPLLIAHKRQITLVFTDVEMPGSMNSLALAHYIDATWPAIGVLVAFGRVHLAPGELPEAAIFIRKPLSADVVHTRVRAFPRRPASRALRSLTER